MKHVLFSVASMAVVFSGVTAGHAEDASWGCQVLLCAASQNPSWHGVPYCVPPMTDLIRAMKKPGFSWPICHEAKAGKPGYEGYEDCPDGFQVGYSSNGSDNSSRSEPDRCVKIVDQCRNNAEFRRLYGNEAENRRSDISIQYLDSGGDSGSSRSQCSVQVSTPRPVRSDPYYFDIPDDKGVKQRFWFNLAR